MFTPSRQKTGESRRRIAAQTDTHQVQLGLPPYMLNAFSHIHIPETSHTNTNNVFRQVNPVNDTDMYIFKVTVFIK